MYSNVNPYLCCNIKEFDDEIKYLHASTFPKLREYFDRLCVNFDPTHIYWNENEDYVRDGYLLRLLFNCIQSSNPFFICLLGQQYGTYLKEDKTPKYLNIPTTTASTLRAKQNVRRDLKPKDVPKSVKSSGSSSGHLENEVFIPRTRKVNWIEKNLIIAQKTGYTHIVNKLTQYNSLLEFQIQLALHANSDNYQYFRFYIRQPEYLEDKFLHFSKDKRRRELIKYEAEDNYAFAKITELKAKLSKRGLTVQYYRSLEQLESMIFNDLTEMIRGLLVKTNYINMDREKLKYENFILNKLNKFLLTESLQNTEDFILKFIGKNDQDTYRSTSKTELQSGTIETAENNTDNGISDENDDFMQILRLRHINLANSIASKNPTNAPVKPSIMLLTAPTGHGKTTFISHLYKDNAYIKDQMCLFYFIRSDHSMFTVLIDVIKQMRLKYLSADCTANLNTEFYDRKSIIEQFHASFKLGPVNLFIDGMCDIEAKNYLPIDIWLPKNFEKNSKFIFTLNNSSKLYFELMSTRKEQCVHMELNSFEQDDDYKILFARLLMASSNEPQVSSISSDDSIEKKPPTIDPHNLLYEKFLKLLPELRGAKHFANPLYCQIIAQEIFSFDVELFDNHPLKYLESSTTNINSEYGASQSNFEDNYDNYSSSSQNQSKYFESSSQNLANTKKKKTVNLFEIYIDDVNTLDELLQNYLKRYILNYSWNYDSSLQVSLENPGWIGDILCLICLSANGISKHSIMNLLFIKGYVNDYRVKESDWQMFRFLFGSFITTGLNGLLFFSHDNFKDAIQSLLLDGFSVVAHIDTTSIMPCQNISVKERDMHLLIINDILNSRLDKNSFSIYSQMFCAEKHDNDRMRCYEALCDLVRHLYMIYDMTNMCRLILNFKVLQVICDQRMKNLNLWFKFVEYVESAIPDEALQVILTNNLTMGMAFEIYLGDQILLLNNKNTNRLKHSQLLQQQASSTGQLEFHLKFSEEDRNEFTITGQSHQDMEISKYISSFIYSEDFDQHTGLIEDFLHMDPMTENQVESINLVLIGRLLVFINLMQHLDKKAFLKKLVLQLYELVHNFVTKNYPLNDNEKYVYSQMLEQLALHYTKTNNFEDSLRIFVKNVELLEDLYLSFDVNNLNSRLKSKISQLRISNRLSLHYSNIALILLKLGNSNGAESLLAKAMEYNRDNLKEEQSTNYLNYTNEAPDTKARPPRKINRKLETRVEVDDSTYYNAKCLLYLNKGFFETFKLDFTKANKYFLMALDVSTKWFGLEHMNTCKIYHYYGCFFSMPNTPFYNTRKAELFFRKAFYICEKYKILITKRNDDTSINNKAHATTEVNENENVKYCLWYKKEQQKNHSYDSLDDDEKNTESAVLYDLGCLLSTYESELLRKEGIECLRRSLDIKSLIFGPDHPECELIKSNITYTEIQNNIEINPNDRNEMSQAKYKLDKRAKTANVLTARSKILLNLEAIKKETNISEMQKANSMIEWLNRNSLQRLKPKSDDFQSSEVQYQISEYFSSKEQTFLDNNNSTATLSTRPKSKPNSSKTIPRSFSLSGYRKSVNNLSSASSHERKCYLPTVSSIDVHNAYSIHGPHSSIKDLLTDYLGDKTKFKPKLAILKPIYYKSAWYDLPSGSTKRRYKQYQKLCPNIQNFGVV